MRKIIFYILFLLFTYGDTYSQPNLQWVARYYDSVSAIGITYMCCDITDNIYFSGHYYYSSASQCWLTFKYNSSGSLQWIKPYGTYGYAGRITTDNTGNIYVCGSTGTNENDQNATIVKYSPSGDTIWTRVYNNTNFRKISPTDMKMDMFNNIYISGQARTDTGSINYDLAVLKYDSSGHMLWERIYDNHINEYAKSINFDSTGNIIVSGITDSLGLYVESYMILKYTPDGTLIWERIFSDYPFDLRLKFLATDKNCNIIVTGEYDVQYPYSSSTMTAKYDKNGNFLWSREYAKGNYLVGPLSMVLDTTGNIFITTPEVLFKYNPDGQYTGIDSNSIQYSQCDYKLCIDNNQYLYTTHVLIDTPGVNYYHISTSKYNSTTGAKVWNENYRGIYNLFFGVRELYLDNSSNLYVLAACGLNGITGDTILLMKYSTLAGVNQKQTAISDKYKLYQNYPNPFNQSTIINVQLPVAGDVKIDIYDITGKKIKTLINKIESSGEHSYLFDASELASGVYFYSLLINGNKIDTKKMLMIK